MPPTDDGHDSREAAMLALAAEVLRPLARMLLAAGVKHASADEVLRQAFIDEARQALQAQQRATTISALSMATGIHRREVNRLAERPTAEAVRPEGSLVSQLVTRWLTDPAYLTKARRPRRLHRLGTEKQPGFDTLARSISRDVHPRSQLDELVRLGVVDSDGTYVSLRVERFVPPQGERELLSLVAFNIGDHLAAAAWNLAGNEPRQLEQSVFADRISEEAAAEVNLIAREHWRRMLAEIVPRLEALVTQDRALDRPRVRRARIGMYAFGAPAAEDASGGEASINESRQP